MNFDIVEFVNNFGKLPDTTSDEKQVYLHFAKLGVEIESNLTRHLGTFDQFCLRCRAEGADLEKISDITNLSIGIVEERLNFLVNHGYLNTDFTLTELGETFLLHHNLIVAFREHPLELLIDTSTGKLVFSSFEFEGVIKKGRLQPAFESNIQPEKFTLTPDYERPLKREALRWINNLQKQNISLDPDRSPFLFSFTFENNDIYSLPIKLNKGVVNRWISEASEQNTVQSNRSHFARFFLPVDELEIVIDFPVMSLFKPDILQAIELIGVSEDISRLHNIGPELLTLMHRTGLITINDNQIKLVRNGLTVFNVVEAHRRIANTPKTIVKVESFFGTILDDEIPLINRKQWHKYPDYILSSEEIDNLCSRLHPGMAFIPEKMLMRYKVHTKLHAKKAVQINLDSESLNNLFSVFRCKRILWGSGWHCKSCGYAQHSAKWNSSISFDDYPNSTRALYLCPSCEKEVDLDVSSGLSGITFLKLDGTTEKHLIGT